MSQSYDAVDADGHVLEPPDLWERYMESRYHDTCPKLLILDDGREIFRLEGDRMIGIGAAEIKDRPAKFGGTGTFGAREGGIDNRSAAYLDGKRGGFDPHERIGDMEAEAIDAAFLFPSLGLRLGAIREPAFAAAACRAYNRWLAEEYCAPYPDRLFGVAMLPMQSIELAIEEMRHARKTWDCRAAIIAPFPQGAPALHAASYEPLWAAAQELDVAIGFHGGDVADPYVGLDRFTHGSEGIAVRHFVKHTFEMAAAATSMIMCGVCDRYPALRVGFLECGGGWIAGWLDRMDRHFDDIGMNDTGLKTRPSDIFRRQCFISFEPVEGTLPLIAEYIGADNILWATDYPHADGFPDAPNLIRAMGLEPELLAKIMAGGARRYYKL